MTDTPRHETIRAGTMLSKVPEVTAWFWIIKILCTTVGESFADWLSFTMGLGLQITAVLFTVVLAGVLGLQLRLNRYVPSVYWLVVVTLSVTGTLYTDILTDDLAVPLASSTGVFAAILVLVFGIWYVRERTLSIHSIVTRPRELYYWLAVLVTFAMGTAAGDWSLELTGWGPSTSVLLPVTLIAAIALGQRLGANAVLTFWLAYILTRPLGANLGDWLSSPRPDHGLGLGTAMTSVLFLAAIITIIVYLTVTHRDVLEEPPTPTPAQHVTADRARERVMLGYFAVVAVLACSLLTWASARPHADTAAEETHAQNTAAAPTPGQATTHFPRSEVDRIRAVVQNTLHQVQAGDQGEAIVRVGELETLWDRDENTLRPLDESSWLFLDGQIDTALETIRADTPDVSAETETLTALLTTLD
ncbi:COG4705 family protein [Nocardia rhamnosiphila]